MQSTGEIRRNKLLEILLNSKIPVSGNELAETLGVSRQVIVTDIALIRKSHPDLIATNSGYVMMHASKLSRIFKVVHNDEQIESELNLIVDLGGLVRDVYVEHKVYGTISVPLNIKSRRDVSSFIEDLKSGVSSPLKNITHGYHYHTIEASSPEVLDEIETGLKEQGFLIESPKEKPVYQPKSYNPR